MTNTQKPKTQRPKVARKTAAPKKKPTSAAAPKPAPVTDPGYTIGDWKGRPQYKCNYCEVDFIDNEVMIKAHVRACPKRIARGEK